MTMEEIKNNLGKVIAMHGSLYEISGFCEEPVVILRLRAAGPGSICTPETIVVLPSEVKLKGLKP